MPARRLPGEFEPQQAALLAWPHSKTDWKSVLDEVRLEMAQLAQAIASRQLLFVLHDPRDPDPLPSAIEGHPNISVIKLSFDDTWCRDFAPITMNTSEGQTLLDFRFDAWGKPYDNQLDDQVTRRLCQHPAFLSDHEPFHYERIDFVLEGGAIESNGHGVLMINWHCLRTRHPTMLQRDLESRLRQHFDLNTIIGIDVSPHKGDDTDGHIDTLARFISPQTIIRQTLSDPRQDAAFKAQLSHHHAQTPEGKQLVSVIDLPAIRNHSAWPLNYANFLLINGACLVPQFGLATDHIALDIMATALPDREPIGIDSCVLISQYGGPHCATMHFPRSDSSLGHGS